MKPEASSIPAAAIMGPVPQRSYSEGDWFLVPVPWEFTREETPEPVTGAVLVARGRAGRVAFVYVFGPWGYEPPASDLQLLRPGDELLMCLLVDDPLRDGTFKPVGSDPSFTRDRWPMPWFSMHTGLPEFPTEGVRTSDDRPFDRIETRPISVDDALSLPEWGVRKTYAIYEKLARPDEPTARLSDLA
jgi:hypothetical protein